MNEEKPKSLDVLGLKPVSEGFGTVAKDASGFLKLICYPAAEEFGLLLQDKVRYWRKKHIVDIVSKAIKFLTKEYSDINLKATPRIVYSILENGSWIDDDKIQEMWAGLLASSCTKDGNDESNLIFINLLSQLTSSEVKILNHSCENAEKTTTIHGLIHPNVLLISLKDLKIISNIPDIHHLDRELDHLRSLGLILCGFPDTPKDTPLIYRRPGDIGNIGSDNIEIDITPSSLALNMYVRCSGSLQGPIEYFGLGK